MFDGNESTKNEQGASATDLFKREEIKFNANNINYSVKKNFANGWDTTFTHTDKQKLQLQAKAKSNTSANLTGTIFLNDREVAKQVDDAKDTDGKYDVKLEYQIQ